MLYSTDLTFLSMRNLTIRNSITNRDTISLNLYLKDVAKIKLLSPDEENELAIKAREGDEHAAKTLINANLRFVISIAKQYQNRGLPLEDLISEGNNGLLKALELYDPYKGFKFISYAVWWIRQSILQAIFNYSKTIRIPISQIVPINRINNFIVKFEQENFRIPSVNEISEALDIDEEQVGYILSALSETVSVDSPIKENDDGILLDILPNQNATLGDDRVNKHSEASKLDAILAQLPDREHDIIKMFFGIGMKEMTHEEIGDKFGLTSERIRQLKEETLKVLKEKYSEELLSL